jgi:hypothetical protein
MTQYKEIQNENAASGSSITIERINEDGSVSYIPADPTNSDYQRYLNPEAEQSTPSVIHEAETK